MLLSAEGRMVLFSSHRLDVVQKVCSRVVILSHGRIVAEEDVRRASEDHDRAVAGRRVRRRHRADDYSAMARDIFDVVRTA